MTVCALTTKTTAICPNENFPFCHLKKFQCAFMKINNKNLGSLPQLEFKFVCCYFPPFSIYPFWILYHEQYTVIKVIN